METFSFPHSRGCFECKSYAQVCCVYVLCCEFSSVLSCSKSVKELPSTKKKCITQALLIWVATWSLPKEAALFSSISKVSRYIQLWPLHWTLTTISIQFTIHYVPFRPRVFASNRREGKYQHFYCRARRASRVNIYQNKELAVIFWYIFKL